VEPYRNWEEEGEKKMMMMNVGGVHQEEEGN